MQITPQYLAISPAGNVCTSWNAIKRPKSLWLCPCCCCVLHLHPAQNDTAAFFTHDLMYLSPAKAERCSYIDKDRKRQDRLAFLRDLIATLPVYNTEGRDWHCVLCGSDYYGLKFCEYCGTGIYSIGDTDTELPECRLHSRFAFTWEDLPRDEPELPDIPDILSQL